MNPYQPNMNLGGFGFGTPTANSPTDNREYYNGTFQTGVDARNEVGNPNNVNPGQGPTVWGPNVVNGGHFGPQPFGGWSQMFGVANGSPSGYYPGTYTPVQGGEVNGRPLSGPNGPLPPLQQPGSGQAAPVAAPHASEPMKAPGTTWGGGFGLSDNSAWGNKGDAALLSRSGVAGSLKDTTNQAATMGARPNATLPGAGSAFGLGGRP